MEELREHTNLVLYENYRTQKLQSSSDSATATPFTKIEEERRAHEAKMGKMEQEMRLVFSQKVAEKEAKLKQSEDEVSLDPWMTTGLRSRCATCITDWIFLLSTALREAQGDEGPVSFASINGEGREANCLFHHRLERQKAELENRKNMLMGTSTTSSTPEAKKKKLGLFK